MPKTKKLDKLTTTLRLTAEEHQMISDYIQNTGQRTSVIRFVIAQALDQARVMPSKHHLSKAMQQSCWKGSDDLEELRTFIAKANG